MARLHRSSRRLLLADYDPAQLLACIKALLALEADWFPQGEGYSIYLRPCIMASSRYLGVTKADRTLISVILSPVGPYFGKGGIKAVSLYLDDTNVRAWPGGAGDCKIAGGWMSPRSTDAPACCTTAAPCLLLVQSMYRALLSGVLRSCAAAGNYAPTIRPQQEALAKHGTAQVLYTLPSGQVGVTRQDATISECGAMNMFYLMAKPDGSGQEVSEPACRVCSR